MSFSYSELELFLKLFLALIMSDFRNLMVYQKARSLNKDIYKLVRDPSYDRTIRHQLTRASTSIMLNIAEGGGRFTKKDQRNFFVIARASAMEC
ncbi:MAG: four helix bundle protein, partial [Bacteroidota bacterium]